MQEDSAFQVQEFQVSLTKAPVIFLRTCHRSLTGLHCNMHIHSCTQAIILADSHGSQGLSPLAHAKDGTPKPLLPVANRPLLQFQLELLERSAKFAGRICRVLFSCNQCRA